MQGNIPQASPSVNQIPAGSDAAIDAVNRLEAAMIKNYEHVHVDTHHSLHGGVYCRTMMIPEGHLITGAQVNVESTLIISGDVTLYIGGEPVRFTGYHVLEGRSGRKQAAFAHLDTHITMICHTEAETVESVEAECTDETDRLMTRRPLLPKESTQ